MRIRALGFSDYVENLLAFSQTRSRMGRCGKISRCSWGPLRSGAQDCRGGSQSGQALNSVLWIKGMVWLPGVVTNWIKWMVFEDQRRAPVGIYPFVCSYIGFICIPQLFHCPICHPCIDLYMSGQRDAKAPPPEALNPETSGLQQAILSKQFLNT